jgi:glucose/arabinose dehydrogenase
MRIRASAFCLALATLLAVTACSSSSAKQPAASPAAAPSAAPDLRAQLLTVADLPAGWMIAQLPNGGGTTPPCTKKAKARLHSISRMDQFFAMADGFPILAESLRDYGTNSRALADYRIGVGVLNRCTDVSFSAGGNSYAGTIGPLALPRLGQQTSAWKFVLTTHGYTFGVDFVVVQEGRELAILMYAGLGTPNPGEVVTLAKKAIARMAATPETSA